MRLELLLAALLFILSGCHGTAPASTGQQKPATQTSDTEKCLTGARAVLGPSVEVLKCGTLTNTADLEAVAAIRLKQFQSPEELAVSQLVILREAAPRWQIELTVDKWITNPNGYLGIQFIDDSAKHVGYKVKFYEHRSDGAPGFTIQFRYLHGDGTSEWPIQISWNPAVKRFQTFAYDEEPPRFEPELKNPPHKHIPGAE